MSAQQKKPSALLAENAADEAGRDQDFRDSLPVALLRAREAVMTLFRPALKAHGLTEQQWRLIRILHENGPLEFHRLAEIACILRPSLTGILGRLEEAGLLVREKTLPDQRKLRISLTEAGRRAFDELMPEVDRVYREVIEQRLCPDELGQLFQLLYKLRRVAETASATADEAEPDGIR